MTVPKLSQEDTDTINDYFGYCLRWDALEHNDPRFESVKLAVLNLISIYTEMRVRLLKMEKEQ